MQREEENVMKDLAQNSKITTNNSKARVAKISAVTAFVLAAVAALCLSFGFTGTEKADAAFVHRARNDYAAVGHNAFNITQTGVANYFFVFIKLFLGID